MKSNEEGQRDKTLLKRLELMKSGAVELENWLRDVIRGGLAALEDASPEYWQNISARMVDAKMGAIGRRIRLLQPMLKSENPQQKVLEELTDLYLFAKGFNNFENLPESLQQELLNTAGVTTKKDRLLALNGIPDKWLILGITEGEEENLRYRRSWLNGEQSEKTILLLDYAWGKNPFDTHWKVGELLEGEAVYYPANYAQRAVLKNAKKINTSFKNLKGYSHFHAFTLQYANAVAANPWLPTFALCLDDVIPIQKENTFFLMDTHSKILSLEIPEIKGWKLIAISGGHPIAVFGEWNGKKLTPLTIFTDERLIVL